jgi:hypothetical protein
MQRKTPAPDPVEPDPERIAALARDNHIFRWARHLERFVKATPAELARWPYVFLSPHMADYGEPRGDPKAWDRLEERARLRFADSGGPLRVGAYVRVHGIGFARVASLAGDIVTVQTLTATPSTYKTRRPSSDTAHPLEGLCGTVHRIVTLTDEGRAKRARAIQRRVQWIVRGLLALDSSRTGGGHRMPRDPSRVWAREAAKYVAAVNRDLGWGGGKPRSPKARAWIGVVDHGPGELHRIRRADIPTCPYPGCANQVNHPGAHGSRLKEGDSLTSAVLPNLYGKIEAIEADMVTVRAWPMTGDPSSGRRRRTPSGEPLAHREPQSTPARCRCRKPHAHHRGRACRALFHALRSGPKRPARYCPDCR